MPAWAVVVLAVLGFAAWWCFVLWLVGVLSGWGRLTRHYRSAAPYHGKVRHFRSAKIGWSNYSGCLDLGTNPDGLYLGVFPLFRPGHPPLFVPWADVSATPTRGLILPYLDLRFEKAPGVAVRLSAALGREIAADANRAWAEDPPTE
ncbi:MAG: hypothetical protein K2X82_31910 [Gemmataceae bacterium]|nr:hypothetical protein [Gemmataceae bacterium]